MISIDGLTSASSGEHQSDPQSKESLEAAVDTLLSQGAEILFGDEKKGVARTRSGLVREIPIDGATTVKVAKYDGEARERIALTLNRGLAEREGVQVGEVTGHIQINRTLPDASLAGVIYMDKEGPLAFVECGLDNEDSTLTEDSEACYRLAAQVGLGDVWVSTMFAHGKTQQLINREVVKLDGPMEQNLRDFLGGLAGVAPTE